MGTFFFVAMVFGVLPFVTSLILGRPLQALVAGVIAVFFLWARHGARTRKRRLGESAEQREQARLAVNVHSATPPPSGAQGGISPTLPRHAGQGSPMKNTVLVVDDRPDARYSMGHPLAIAGFDVRETATGRDALRLARLQVHAIVLDLVLPDMNGYEVLRKLKDDPATQNIPVIMKTAVHLDDGHREVALDAGASEYFAEPFDMQALVTSVRRVLGEDTSAGSLSKP
jgi:CheY-like chemotaxis protein